MRKLLLFLLLPVYCFGQVSAPTNVTTKLSPATSFTPSSWYKTPNFQYGWLNTGDGVWEQFVTGRQWNQFVSPATTTVLGGYLNLRGGYMKGPIRFDQDTASANPLGHSIEWDQKTNYAQFRFTAPGDTTNPRDNFSLILGDDSTKRKNGQAFNIIRNTGRSGFNVEILDSMYRFSKLRADYNGSPFITGRQVGTNLVYTASSDSTNGGRISVNPNPSFTTLTASTITSNSSYVYNNAPVKTTISSYATANNGAYDANKPNVVYMGARNNVGTGSAEIVQVPVDSVANFTLGITKQALANKDAMVFDGSVVSKASASEFTGEGLVMTQPVTGNIINVFRKATETSEESNTADIYRRRSLDGGKTWLGDTLVYSSVYDDRSLSGGLMPDGSIAILFQRFDDVAQAQIDMGYIRISGTGYNTVSAYTVYTPIVAGSFTYGQTTPSGNGKMLVAIRNIRSAELLTTVDNGVTWQSGGLMWDYRPSGIQTDETSITWLGGSDLIAHSRNQVKNTPPYVFKSNDYGATWTYMGIANINGGLFGQSPLVWYDVSRDVLFTYGSTRPSPSEDGQLLIYTCTKAEALASLDAYALKKIIPRPYPNSMPFYGYPTITKRLDGSYFYIYSDGYVTAGDNTNNYIGSLHQSAIRFEPTEWGQNHKSEYDIQGYQYNIYNKRFEPQDLQGKIITPYTANNLLHGPTLGVTRVNTSGVTINKSGSGSNGATLFLNGWDNSNSVASILEMYRSKSGAVGNKVTTTNGQILAAINIRGTSGAVTPVEAFGARMLATQTGNATLNAVVPTKLSWFVSDTSSSVERLTFLPFGQTGFSKAAPTAYLDVRTNTAAMSGFRLTNSSLDVTSPNNGDIWNNAGVLKWYNGSTTQTVLGNSNTATVTNKTLAVASNPITSTANRAAQFNSSTGNLEPSSVTNTELGYVGGVTSSIQTQLNAKGSGTVTNVTSANTDIGVASGTTTPVLTLNRAGTYTWTGQHTFNVNNVHNNVSSTYLGVSSSQLTVGGGGVAGPSIGFQSNFATLRPYISWGDSGSMYGISLNPPDALTNNRTIKLPNATGTLMLGTAQRLTASGTGAATTITIPHGLSGITTGSKITVQAMNAPAAGVSYATVDITNAYIVYTVAPVLGVTNLDYTITITP